MTHEQLDILLTEEVEALIQRYREEDPLRVALHLARHGALIATQLKYLHRARLKLPSYYSAGCILPPLAYEQSSSEAVAAEKKYEGSLCIDLTCGLGVDAVHFSKSFERVVAVECDEVTARVAKENFARLGVSNIEVIHTSAETYLSDFHGKADLIYVDPARRGPANRKLFRLEECSPDVLMLLPALSCKTNRMVIKASPLFDVEEAFRLFGEQLTVEVISAQGECKEVLIEKDFTDLDRSAGILRVTRAGEGSLTFPRQPSHIMVCSLPTVCRWLFIPDVALCKSRQVIRYAAQMGFYAVSEGGYCLSEHLPAAFFGRICPIRKMMPYHTRTLKADLKTQGIHRCTFLKRDFPLSIEELYCTLGVIPGDQATFAFTCIGKEKYVIQLDSDFS